MSRFDSVTENNEFKNLCLEILPPVRRIEQTLKKYGVEKGGAVRIGSDGYLALDIYEGKWNMVRYKENGQARICYEYSEEIKVLDDKGFDRVFGNLVEISLVFASLQSEIKDGREIDDITWKKLFVQWANEFEEKNFELDHCKDINYLDITEFAKEKILKFAEIKK